MDSKKILKTRQLSMTASRILLLQILTNSKIPLSGKEIEGLLGGKCNRATIYRNLSAFSSKGIVQRILSGEAVKYKINKDTDQESISPDHVHFKCSKCHQLFCMEDLLVNDYILPEGFVKIENQFLIVGICKNCNGKKEL